MAELTKGALYEAGVVGGEKIHAQGPDGNVLCGAVGDGGSEPYPLGQSPHMHGEDPLPFNPKADGACKKCTASWKNLPD